MTNSKNTCINKYYVYLHFNEDQEGPFFCGSGIKERAGKSSNRNKYWHELAVDGWWKKIIAGPLSKEDARELEEFVTLEFDEVGYCQANLKAGDIWMDKEPHFNIGRKRPDLAKKNRENKWGLGNKRPDLIERNKKSKGNKKCLEVMK